jgi:hypothetical protein
VVVLKFADDISVSGGLQRAVHEQRVIHRSYVCGPLESSNKCNIGFSLRMKDKSLSVMVKISRLGKFSRQYLICNGIFEYYMGKYYLLGTLQLERLGSENNTEL